MTDVSIEDHHIPGPHGSIPVRTYLVPGATQGLVWAHGGAFAFGGLDQEESDWVARQLADQGVAVVAVDYRLAPTPDWLAAAAGVPQNNGVHYPVASEEMMAAFLWATTLVSDIPTDAWSLGGASAGANLAASAALRLRDEGNTRPRSLLFAYGLFHHTLPAMSDELAAKFAALPPEAAVFTPEALHMIGFNYVGNAAHLQSAYAFPGGHDLTGLPPTFLINSDADSIRASAEQFGAELISAGVDVLMINEKGTLHGHLDGMQDAAHRSIGRMSSWLTSDLISGGQR